MIFSVFKVTYRFDGRDIIVGDFSTIKTVDENGYEKECIPILEFAINTGTDISGTYKLLATIYVKYGEKEKLDSLKSKTDTLNSAMKNPIDRMLQEFDL